MNDEESRHWDNVCIGLMTLETLVVVGMFGLLGFGGATKDALSSEIRWVISLAAIGASLTYLLCIGSGIEAIFNTTLSPAGKLAKCRTLAIQFLVTIGFVILVACVTVVSHLTVQPQP